MKCVAHSYDLVVMKACTGDGTIPSSLWRLLHAIPTWFRRSSIRQAEFSDIRKIMDPEGRGIEMNPWKEWNETRFLSRSPAIERTRYNYTQLCGYFNACAKPKSVAILNPLTKCEVRQLSEQLKDPTVILYLTFLSPIIREFEKVNAAFQVFIFLCKYLIIKLQY